MKVFAITIALFTISYFFMHKQVIMNNRFTGRSKGAALFLTYFGILDFIFLLFIAYRIGAKLSVLHAIGCFVLSFIIATIINSRITRAILRSIYNPVHTEQENTMMYNYKCDVTSTVLAWIGIPLVLLADIILFVLTKK